LLNPSKSSILIIDDDTTFLRVFSRIFQQRGYKATVDAKGVEAIEKLGKGCFDVASVNLRFPDMESTELLPVIEMTSPQTVKIMLSGNDLHHIIGADALLGKPINPKKLLSVFENKLRDRNLET
jgi:CheY-like chemotaxis protein